MNELKDTDETPRPLNPPKPPVRPYGASKVKDQLNHALDTFVRIFREDMHAKQQQEQEIVQLKARIARLVDFVSELNKSLRGNAIINYGLDYRLMLTDSSQLLKETPQQSLVEIQAGYLQSILAKYDCGAMEYVLRQELEQLRASVKDGE